jgi:hypothetical protein
LDWSNTNQQSKKNKVYKVILQIYGVKKEKRKRRRRSYIKKHEEQLQKYIGKYLSIDMPEMKKKIEAK